MILCFLEFYLSKDIPVNILLTFVSFSQYDYFVTCQCNRSIASRSYAFSRDVTLQIASDYICGAGDQPQSL